MTTSRERFEWRGSIDNWESTCIDAVAKGALPLRPGDVLVSCTASPLEELSMLIVSCGDQIVIDGSTELSATPGQVCSVIRANKGIPIMDTLSISWAGYMVFWFVERTT